jgi:sec-independent protein translocase protein TatA
MECDIFSAKEGQIMWGLGLPEILLILAVLAVIFGAGRLPELGANLGKGIKNFKKSFTDPDDELEKKKIEEGNGKV